MKTYSQLQHSGGLNNIIYNGKIQLEKTNSKKIKTLFLLTLGECNTHLLSKAHKTSEFSSFSWPVS